MQIEKNILIVDDEEEHLLSLERIFKKEGYNVITCTRGNKAIEILRSEHFQVVLTDLVMPGEVDGLDVLKTAVTLEVPCQIILMTAFGNVELAVQAMKSGAYDFITKPIKKMEVIKTVDRAMEKMGLLEENRKLRRKLDELDPMAEIIGSSAAILKPLRVVNQAAPSTATILIQGDSGTGKELFAKEIHRLSGREKFRMVAVNCAALPETILESELFGYEKGAFTGANHRKDGRIIAAHKGTLFLDEIADMSVALQAKLLRVLQEGEVERLGSNTPTKIDFRLVAATNKNLKQLVDDGKFREDLYYRLNVITIILPPLSERSQDIPLLTQHFIAKYCKKNNCSQKGITHETMDMVTNHQWPGNVRELEKRIERAVVLSTSDMLKPHDFFDELPETKPQQELTIPFGLTLEEIEQRVIKDALSRTAGDKKLAAQILGIAVRTIYRKLDQLS